MPAMNGLRDKVLAAIDQVSIDRKLTLGQCGSVREAVRAVFAAQPEAGMVEVFEEALREYADMVASTSQEDSWYRHGSQKDLDATRAEVLRLYAAATVALNAAGVGREPNYKAAIVDAAIGGAK